MGESPRVPFTLGSPSGGIRKGQEGTCPPRIRQFPPGIQQDPASRGKFQELDVSLLLLQEFQFIQGRVRLAKPEPFP